MKCLFLLLFKEGMAGITADDLKEQFQRHEGLLENLTLNIGIFTFKVFHII